MKKLISLLFLIVGVYAYGQYRDAAAYFPNSGPLSLIDVAAKLGVEPNLESMGARIGKTGTIKFPSDFYGIQYAYMVIIPDNNGNARLHVDTRANWNITLENKLIPEIECLPSSGSSGKLVEMVLYSWHGLGTSQTYTSNQSSDIYLNFEGGGQIKVSFIRKIHTNEIIMYSKNPNITHELFK